MNKDILFPLIALVGCAILWIVIKLLDKECEDAKKKDREVKENGCVNAGCIVGVILVLIGFIAMNLQECSHSSRNSLNIEYPIRRR